MLNPGGFDYQAWLIEQNYSATGYIVDSSLNKPIQAETFNLGVSLNLWISCLRAQVLQAIAVGQLSDLGKAVIAALTIGYKGGLDNWWDELVRWGIIHLMVISGLHGIGGVSRILFGLSTKPTSVIAQFCIS